MQDLVLLQISHIPHNTVYGYLLKSIGAWQCQSILSQVFKWLGLILFDSCIINSRVPQGCLGVLSFVQKPPKLILNMFDGIYVWIVP